MSVDYAREGAIATILLNNPRRMNALTAAMQAQLQACWRRFADDRDALVAIVTGSGEKAFSAGADVTEMGERPEGWYRNSFWSDPTHGVGNTPEVGMPLWKPVIAAINGHCIGAGISLAAGADIRLCSGNATFAFPEVKLGLTGVAGPLLLSRLLSPSTAARIVLTGDTFSADEALRWGFVSEVHPLSELLSRAHGLAERIAANAPLAVRASKEIMVRGRDLPFAAALVLGEHIRRVLRESHDSREGPIAFSEKRQPRFTGK